MRSCPEAEGRLQRSLYCTSQQHGSRTSSLLWESKGFKVSLPEPGAMVGGWGNLRGQPWNRCNSWSNGTAAARLCSTACKRVSETETSTGGRERCRTSRGAERDLTATRCQPLYPLSQALYALSVGVWFSDTKSGCLNIHSSLEGKGTRLKIHTPPTPFSKGQSGP